MTEPIGIPEERAFGQSHYRANLSSCIDDV